jgi:hypothetical protein
MNETNVMTTETSTALSRYDAVCYALAEVKNLAEIKGIADKMTALKEYARCANNRELEIDAAELRIRAERRLGQMMDALGLKAGKPKRGLKAGKPKSKGFLNNPLPLFGVPKSDEPVRPTLAQMGIDKNLANRARKLASIPDRVMESKIASWRQKAERDAGRVSVNILRKDRQTSLHVRTSAGGSVDDLQQLTAAGFRATAILVDPPWKLLTRGNHGGGRTDQHTRTDGLDLIKALPVAQLAAPDAILCMWIADCARKPRSRCSRPGASCTRPRPSSGPSRKNPARAGISARAGGPAPVPRTAGLPPGASRSGSTDMSVN